MTDILYRWPEAAKFGRRVPKEKFYEHGTVNTAVREKFISDVQRITWGYKLAEASINLPGTATVPEVQVFTIDAKASDVGEPILNAIDKAIPFPILFVLRHDGKSRPIAAYKRPSEAASGQWVLGEYHAAPWQPDELPRHGLPVALDLHGLYEQLLRQHLAVPARTGETLRDQLDRLAQLQAKQVAAAKLETQLAQEKQFNRKVEINAQLRTMRSELHALAS